MSGEDFLNLDSTLDKYLSTPYIRTILREMWDLHEQNWYSRYWFSYLIVRLDSHKPPHKVITVSVQCYVHVCTYSKLLITQDTPLAWEFGAPLLN